MTDPVSVLSSLRVMFGEDSETVEALLIAAVYCRAINEDDSPRSIADALFKALPDTEAWPKLRDALVAQLEQ